MRIASRTLGTLSMAAVITLVGGLTAALIAQRMLTPETRAEIACIAGFVEFAGQKCLTQKLGQARANFDDEMKRLRAEMETERATLEGKRARLERERKELLRFLVDPKIDLIQAKGEINGAFVVVAASYKDPDAKTGLIAAMCYASRDMGGVDPRLPLARMSSSHVLSQTTIDANALAAFKFDAADLMAAQRLCPWPNTR